MRPRILLVGATGVFGRRLAERLAHFNGIELMLAARRVGPLEALASQLRPTAQAQLSTVILDRDRPGALEPLALLVVVDAAGPFRSGGFVLAQAAAAAGAHYVDLADGRAFVSAFPAALNAQFEEAERAAITGASSTPALSDAAVACLTAGWTRIESVVAAISPGARAPRGEAVIASILSWAGQPVCVFRNGAWRREAGWSSLWRVEFPGLGRRRLALAETPDLDLLAARWRPEREALFFAGLELAPMHLGLWLLSGLVRLRLVRTLTPLAAVLKRGADLLAPLGSDRGGMIVLAEGWDASGRPARARFGLWAESGAGPTVPALPAAALVRALVGGRAPSPGARACVGLLSLTDILSEAGALPIHTRIDRASPGDPVLMRRVLGSAFEALPAAVRHVHGGRAIETFPGVAFARGSPGVATLVRSLLGLPPPGRSPGVSVSLEPQSGRERWTRRFGPRSFSSDLRDVPSEFGVFEERLGPLAFRFKADAEATGFRWRLVGWRVGPVRLPAFMGPRIRAVSFARDGVYRFRVLVAHPWLGVVFAYSGRLREPE